MRIGEERGRWMVIRRTSGKVVELSTVWVSSNTKPRRNKRKGMTSAQKQDENERDCVKQLARTINCNFSHGDLWITVHYDEAGMCKLEEWAKENRGEDQSWEDAMLDAAAYEIGKYLRRLKRAMKKAGKDEEMRYIVVDSDMDGETGELVRLHHHIILPRVSYEEAAEAWKFGSVDYQILRDQEDYTPLAAYICKQARRRAGKKKYRVSKNLKQPIVNERWAAPGEELRPDRHGKVVARNEWEEGRPQYIRFIKGAALPAGRGPRKKAEEAMEGLAAVLEPSVRPVPPPVAEEIRCPGCGQMLALRKENGMIEYKARRQTILTERATLCCQKCGRSVTVGKS